MRLIAAATCLALCALAFGADAATGAPPALGAAQNVAHAARQLTGFLSKPTEQLAVPGMAASGEITPEGDLYTGWAEYEIRFGAHLAAWNQPTRTLPNPALPYFTSTLSDGAVRYAQSIFAVPVDGRPVAYLTITATNRSAGTATARLEMAIAYTRGAPANSPDGGLATRFRYQRPSTGTGLGAYHQPGQAFSRRFAYSFAGRDLIRSGLLLGRGPAAPSRTLRTQSPGTLPPGSAPQEDTPTASHDARIFQRRLASHEAVSLTWQIPLRPPAAGAATDRALALAPLGRALSRLHRLWARQERGMMGISVPERRVTATYLVAVSDILDSRLLTSAGWEQCPNRLQYQAFWIRDSAIETQALDLAGLHEAAAQNLAFLASFQQPDGLLISQQGQYDGLGQALWAIGQHAQLTQDAAYATQQLPRLEAAIGWLSAAVKADPLGLLPPTEPGDNELAYGHIAGDDLWAAAGLRAAVALAKLAGRADLASSWQALDESFETSLRAAIAKATAATGHIPPVLDATGGQDWGNYWAAFPAQILSPTSPEVQATLAWAQSHSLQGLPTYEDGAALHGYLGFRVFETELAAGDAAGAVAGLYAELAHTTATDAGWELIPAPFQQRASATDLAPHGVFAAEYIALLRNMLLAEAPGGEVLLLAGASPAWLGPGQHIAVASAPTDAGTLSFAERSTAAGETLSWHGNLAPGTALRWALPWWASEAHTSDGTPLSSSVPLPGDSGTVTVDFAGQPPPLSYARAVTGLNAEYEAAGRPAPLTPAAR